MTRPTGQSVRIVSGMAEFVGKSGTIIDNTERDGRTTMYRVRLDEPVIVPGVGQVTDDLWAGGRLKTAKR